MFPISALVEIQDVSFAYDDRTILSSLDMHFPHGQVIAVMGGSGSGKTTILRLIAGLIRPQSGTIQFENQVIASLRSRELYRLRRKMGMLFQQGALLTDLNVFDNVAFPLREHTDLSETLIRSLVLLKLNSVGLKNAAHLLPRQISGGMARRVALARTIVLDPTLIMYDEPFAGLDPISMAVIANLIRTLNDALDATSILVSHNVDEAFSIADTVYFLSQGKIAAYGTPTDMRSSDNLYVQQFIHAQTKGPVPFHYPGASLAQSLGIVD